MVIRAQIEKHPDNRVLVLVWGRENSIDNTSEIMFQIDENGDNHFGHSIELPEKGTYVIWALLERLEKGKIVEYSSSTSVDVK